MTDNSLNINTPIDLPFKRNIFLNADCFSWTKKLVVLMMVITFLVVIYFFISPISAKPNLISVVQIFRHGQRTPLTFYPNDPYSDPAHWPETPGELTNLGKTQQYELGKFTRKKYNDILPAVYSKDFFHAQTTDFDRAHMSAQCNVLGLFPPSETGLWNPHITWNPIPIHLSNVITGEFFCKAMFMEIGVALKDPYWRNIDSTYSDIFKYINKHSGCNITTVLQTSSIFDPLNVEREFGFTLPAWTEAVFPEPLTTMAGYHYQMIGYNTKLARLNIGLFMNEVMEHFEKIKQNSSSSQFFRMYSGHDINIAPILSALGAFNNRVPSFTSSINLELWESSGIYYVNVYYKNGDSVEKIISSGCPQFNCNLDDLKEQLRPILIDTDSWTAECAKASF